LDESYGFRSDDCHSIVMPFSLNKNGFWIFELFASTLGEYPYASLNDLLFVYLLKVLYDVVRGRRVSINRRTDLDKRTWLSI